MTQPLLILGAGGHAKVVADCAVASEHWDEVYFLDDRYPVLTQVGQWPVIGKISEMENFIEQYPHMALGVGVSYDVLRVVWLKRATKAGACFPAIVHPSATVSPFARVGAGTVVFAGAVVNVDAHVGEACIINTVASIDHDCVIGDGSHVSPGASLAGGVTVGQLCWVGMGAQIIQGVSIGDHAIIGAGAVVIRNVESMSTVVGIPAIPVVKVQQPSVTNTRAHA